MVIDQRVTCKNGNWGLMKDVASVSLKNSDESSLGRLPKGRMSFILDLRCGTDVPGYTKVGIDGEL